MSDPGRIKYPFFCLLENVLFHSPLKASKSLVSVLQITAEHTESLIEGNSQRVHSLLFNLGLK